MKKNNLKKYIKFMLVGMYILYFLCSNVYSVEENGQNSSLDQAKESMTSSLNLNEYVSTINKYAKESQIEGVDIASISKDLLENSSTDYTNIFVKVIALFSKELVNAIKGAITIFIIVVLMAIISSLELDKNSDITKIAKFVCFLAISTVTIKTFLDTVMLFKNVILNLTTIMQVVSPFLMSVLLASGAISTTGIIQPLILFIASCVGFIVTYIVVPFLSISVAFNVICNVSENFRLERLSKMFSSSCIWIVGIVLTLFLGVLSLETSLTSSVDSLGVKTTQVAVSNFVPVVGKFFSDSFETVVGATKIIGKVGGTLGIITMIVIVSVPVIKIGSIMGIYMLLNAISEPIYSDDNITKYISGFINVYKVMLGILIGILILFVISTGIILNLTSSIIV